MPRPARPRGVVYRATTPSGKVYIGITTGSLKRRAQGHIRDAVLGSQRLFAKAIRKYGPDNIRFEVIGSADTWAELCRLEIEHIRAAGSAERKHGYNRTDGGEGRSYTDPEEIERQSVCQRRRFARREEREKDALAKGARPFLVFRDSEVVGEWLVIQECSRELGVPATKICACLKGRRNGAGPYTFRYVGELVDGPRLLSKHSKVDSKRPFRVYRDGTQVGEFSSRDDCASALGLDKARILECLRGKRISQSGFMFRYITDSEKDPPLTDRDRKRQRSVRSVLSKNGRPFIAYKDGVAVGEFILQAECASQLDVPPGGISLCLSGELESSGGFTFRYRDERSDRPVLTDVERARRMSDRLSIARGGRPFAAYRGETFVGVFQSQTECARALGLSQGNLGSCLRGRRASTKGYTFRYAGEVPRN